MERRYEVRRSTIQRLFRFARRTGTAAHRGLVPATIKRSVPATAMMTSIMPSSSPVLVHLMYQLAVGSGQEAVGRRPPPITLLAPAYCQLPTAN